MINAPRLLKDLQRFLKESEDDLRERVKEVPDIDAGLREQHRAAKEAGRTGVAYETWRDEFLTQAAVAWILGCVFVRFLEDNGLIPAPLISGPGARRQRALDEHELYFKQPDRRTHSDRDYLLHVFEQVRALPPAAELFDPKHNPLWAVGPTGDGATELLRFWQRVNPDTGALIHDFTDLPSPAGRGVGGEGSEGLNTRFLGDLYQYLSEGARKKYALLQTPEFVEEFILDRTLTPAIEEFGFQEVRLIDPTCGSGHFLLGAFHRLFELWVSHEPGTNPRALAQRALDQVFGVDLNPYAVAIARFRLLITALKASGVHSIRREEAPAFHVNVAAGDSLLHGRRFDQLDLGSGADQLAGRAGIGHAFFAEDLEALDRILGQQYHAVVGNPPYITVKDKALNRLYRDRYQTCHRQYSLAVPFTERFFQLASAGRDFTTKSTKNTKERREGLDGGGAGFVGMITANSFMKREFGKKLIEEFFPRVDLTHVIDTSGAYIPGHGTPTVILLGRDWAPVGDTIRTVMGITGEPETPADPAKGLVWSAIVSQVDRAGSESEWVSSIDTDRLLLSKHPWSIGGGGATKLKTSVESRGSKTLEDFVVAMGRVTHTGADETYFAPPLVWWRHRLPAATIVPLVEGDIIRDWELTPVTEAILPYDSKLQATLTGVDNPILRHLWHFKQFLVRRREPNGTHEEIGLTWYEWSRFQRERFLEPLGTAFAFVATHNHFVLDRGGKVFKQSAPVIKLPAGGTEDDHLALIGLLNSSTACFWMKQVFHNKGVGGIGGGIGDEGWEPRYEFTGTGLKQFPVTEEKPLDLAWELDRLARERQAHLPAQLTDQLPLTRAELDAHRAEAECLLRRMIALQEELDWRCYRLYGITTEELTDLPSPSGRGEGKPHGVLPQDLLTNARDLRKGQTEAEALFWLLVRDRRLGGFKFRRQHPIPPFVIDFYCHEKRLAVELDGGQHAERAARDERRTQDLARRGIRVIRFWDNQVLAETEAVLEALWLALNEGEGVDFPHPNPSPGGRGALPEIKLGERAFEIVMARKMAAGQAVRQECCGLRAIAGKVSLFQ
jgi:very-short-patch-repair endonuclease